MVSILSIDKHLVNVTRYIHTTISTPRIVRLSINIEIAALIASAYYAYFLSSNSATSYFTSS